MNWIFVRKKIFNWKLIYINFLIFAIGVTFFELFLGDWLKDNNLNHLMLIRNSDWVFRMVDDHPYPHMIRNIFTIVVTSGGFVAKVSRIQVM